MKTNSILGKTVLLLSMFQDVASTGGTIYMPGNAQTQSPNNTNLNPLGSQYANQYGHQTSALVQRLVRNLIYDTAPQQFLDLKILSMKTPEQIGSDEWSFHEMGYGRDPIVCDAVGSPVSAATSYSLVVLDKNRVAKDMIVVFPDNTRGTITNVVASGLGATITITAETGETLPALPTSSTGELILSYLSEVEADGADYISQRVRFDTIERTNYIQMLVKAMRFGAMEIYKYNNSGTLKNYIMMQRQRMYQQFRVSLSNIYWNGKKAEVTLANGAKAKTTEGVFVAMQRAGSANASVTLANTPSAIERLALDTEFGVYGQTRFLYGSNRAIHFIAQQYKRTLTRYTPNDMVAKLGLNSIDIGSSRIVLTPIKRFEDNASFPAAWRSRLLLVDQDSITTKYALPEKSGTTLDRVNNGTLQNYADEWVAATFGVQFVNPLGSGYLDITDLD